MNTDIIYINDSKEESYLEYFKRVWNGRELIYSLVKKELLVKMSKTLLGRLWLIIPTLITIVIYSIFFGQLLQLDTGTSPYPLFLISGLALWNYFSQTSSIGANALFSNQEIIRKTPFPKIILNISYAAFILIEQIPLLILISIISAFYQKPNVYQVIFTPFAYLLIVLLSFGVGNILANLSIRKRDIIHAYAFILQISLWLTPVFYPTTLIPEKYAFLIYINPITGILDLFRWSLNIQELNNLYFLYSILSTFIILFFSFKLYKKNEKTIGDYI